MSEKDPTVWGIHAGKTGDAHTLFLKRSCVGLGWAEMGDLSKIRADREAFKARIAEVYPLYKEAAIPGAAGQLFRFVHVMKDGDIVVYPSKQDRNVNIGRVEGGYRYDRATEPGYPHVRPIKWFKHIPRTAFTQGALYEIGSAMSFFQVKNNAEEFATALEGRVSEVLAAEDAIIPTAERTEEVTADFILKRLARDLKGHPMEEFVANLLNTMGYRTTLFPDGPNTSPDIIAHKDALRLESPIIKVEVKSGEGSVDEPTVAALYGKASAGEFAMLITLGDFTSRARGFARGKGNLRLIAGDELSSLILQHYEQLDSRYKRLLPLRRVYVPEPGDESEA